MLTANTQPLAIACATGSFKVAFVHGVLSAFEQTGVRAHAYAAASASVFPAAWAAIGKANDLGIDYWLAGAEVLSQPGMGMSQMVLGGIQKFGATIREQLFAPNQPEFYIATSAVVTPEAAEQTQGTQARRLGRRLLLSAAQKNRSWVDEHLQPTLFTNRAVASSTQLLNADNFDQVAYASIRMLHAWDLPAWVGERPYVDASYTSMALK